MADFDEMVKGLPVPYEGTPTAENSKLLPLGVYLEEFERFAVIKGFAEALTLDEDEGDPDNFDWDNINEEEDRLDSLARMWITGTLSLERRMVSGCTML